MASAQRFGIFPCSFVHAGGTLNLTQMDSFDCQTGVQKAEIIPGGAVDRAHIGIASAQPKATFSTRDLATLFTDVSISAGLALTGTATFRLQEREDGSTFGTGTTHETFVGQTGFLYPTQIQASQDGADGASATCEVVPLWDGSNAPWIHNTSVDFGAVSAPAFVSRFFLGPVYHNSGQLAGVKSVTVNTGINYDAQRFDGEPYARRGAIVARQPTITFTLAKVDAVQALNMFGAPVSSSFAVYFQKGVASGTRVAAATAQHCKISCTAGDITQDNVSVSGTDDGMVNVTVMPTGTLAVSVASAIP